METSSGAYGGNPLARGTNDELSRLLDRAVAASSNGIIITDPNLPDAPIIYVNPAFERTTGYSRDEVVGLNCRFLQNGDRDQPAIEEVREAIGAGRECRVVLKNYKKDGTIFWNELYVSPVHDEEGRLTNFVGVQNDVTERKRVEEERDLLLAREQLARAESVKSRRRLSLLAAAGTALASASLDHGATLQKISRLAVPELADWCLVDLVDEEGVAGQAASAHADPEKEGLLREISERRGFGEDDPGSTARVLRTGRPVLVPEVSADALEEMEDGERCRIIRELEPRSIIAVPLLARGRTLGAMTLVSSDPGRRYDEEDLSLAENLAYRCAQAVDNARLYRERSFIARTLQQSILPRLPEAPGLEVGTEYLPMGEENEVGGDFYDLIEVKDGACLAVIGDVRGKGPVAAAVTALARYTIRAVALGSDSPAAILASLNEAMLRQLSDYQFCTAACVHLLSNEGGLDLTVALGGHPAPLILRAGGSVEEAGGPGKVLGVFHDAGLRETAKRLEPGDALVLYTDGVIEARAPDGALFGGDRLVSVLGALGGLDASLIARKIRDAALEFQEGTQHDDLAIFVLRVPEEHLNIVEDSERPGQWTGDQ